MECSPPSSEEREQRWADSSPVGRHLCPGVHPRPAPGSLPLLPASGPGESKGGPCPSPRAASAPASPLTWGSWRGQRSEAGPWSLPPGPGSGIWRPEFPGSGNTGRVCGACKCGCVCVHVLLISLGIFRAGLEEVGNRRISSSVSSGREGIRREACRARRVEPQCW